MRKNFKSALGVVWQVEGDYVNHPLDPGGATKYGITRKTLSAWRGQTVSVADVKALRRAEAEKIYRARYWASIAGDWLADGIDLAVFDFAVNSGPKKAAKHLQRLVGAKVDGIIGGMTLAAVARVSREHVITGLCRKRLSYLTQLANFWKFGRGWVRRVIAVEEAALALARATSTPRTEHQEAA